ncbi:MAG TPA: hypothetical protein VGG27_19675 [Magnetospirillaceae bacterium]|jgi:hypothetical protein
MIRAAILTLVFVIASVGLSRADDVAGTIALHRIDDEGIASFAARFFYKRHPHPVNWSFAKRLRSEINWAEIVHDHAYAADAPIGDADRSVLIVVVDNPDWCEANGCLGDIFRKTPKGYELICETALPTPDVAPLSILPTIENGYHDLATADHAILWNERQDFDSGQLCSIESRSAQ